MAANESKCRGVVLRTTDISDNDKLLTVLTDEFGKITVSAKGARSLKSKFMPISQQFAYGEFAFTSRGEFKWLKDATVAESFFSVRRDLPRLALACYVCAVTEQLSLENQPDRELLRLTLNTLYMLCEDKYSLDHVKAVFEISAVSLGGFAPEAEFCGNCARTEGLSYLDVVGGVVLCGDCVRRLFRDNEIPPSVFPVTAGVIDAVRFVSAPENRNAFAFKLPDDEAAELYDIAEKYLLAQLDCGFKTLSFYHEVKD